MSEDHDVIPASMKPMMEAAEAAMAKNAVALQEQAEFAAEWKRKAISIEAADKFLESHGKTGMFLVYWDQDERSQVTIQSLVCGKTRADRVLANLLHSACRKMGLC